MPGAGTVCGVWEYEKTLLPSGHRIYDKDMLLDPGSSPVPELIAYVDDVLRATGIQWGAAHAEVIVTPKGPTLVRSSRLRPTCGSCCSVNYGQGRPLSSLS